MISIEKTADLMIAHAREIARECKTVAKVSGLSGWRVLAEVDNDEKWRGAGRVSPGTGSLLSYERRGRACFFTPSRHMTVQDVRDQIEQWIEQSAVRESAGGVL